MLRTTRFNSQKFCMVIYVLYMDLRTNSNLCRLVLITEVESVYCAVRTESLYNTDASRP
jgi:hypothetical protein